MKSIAIIFPYFGTFKKDIIFWLESVKNNSTIDFLLFTDIKIVLPPENLKIIQMSFEEFRTIIQQNFNFNICLLTPYKVCDFRPCFGEALKSYIKNYDFWGYSDTDLVYGDLRKFLTDEILNTYNRILGRGHFSLFRNTKEINALYKQNISPTYQQVFTFSEGCAFDEYWGTSRYWDLYLSDQFYQAFPFDDIDCSLYAFHSQMKRKKDIGKSNFIYAYKNKKLYRVYEKENEIYQEEIMYVHFQKRKMEVQTTQTSCFMMVPNNYIPYIENLNIEILRRYSKEHKFYIQHYKILFDRIKNKIKKIITLNYSSTFGKPKLPKDAIKYYTEK